MHKTNLFAGQRGEDMSHTVSGYDCYFDDYRQHCDKQYAHCQHAEQLQKISSVQRTLARSARERGTRVLQQKLSACNTANFDCVGLLLVMV